MSPRATIAAALSAALLLWSSSAPARPSGPVRALACAPSRSEVAAALVGESVWITRDSGSSWSREAVLSPALADHESHPGAAEAGEPADESAVIPDFAPTPPEEQHRVGDSELLARERSELAGGVGGTSRVDLAVGDDGSFAALLGEQLFVRWAGSRAIGRAKVEGAVGVHLDGWGGLWVAAERALLGYARASTVSVPARQHAVACVGSPSRGASADQLVVPLEDGVARISVPRYGAAVLDVERVGPVAAAATAKIGLLVVARGRVSRLVPGAGLVSMFPVNGVVRELLVAGDGTVWVDAGGAGWLAGGAARRFRATTALAVAVDAVGRVWIGTPHGPLAPGSGSGPTGPARPAPVVPVGRFVAGAMSRFDRELGDPPCRPPVVLVPRARVLLGAGHGSTRETDLPGPIDEAGRRTWAYAGIRLEWSFGPVDPTECVNRLADAAERRDERRRRVASLVEAWRRAVAREERARCVAEAIEARTERDRLAELIRIASGFDPREE